jgi:uncharacterized lipoprotein YajG
MKPVLKLMTKFFLISIFFLQAGYAQAQSISAEQKQHAEVTYMGIQDGLMVFSVNMADIPAKSYIRISDEEGTFLFEEKLNSALSSKRYKINPAGFSKIRFDIYNKSFAVSQSFQVQVQVEEKLLVKAIR